MTRDARRRSRTDKANHFWNRKRQIRGGHVQLSVCILQCARWTIAEGKSWSVETNKNISFAHACMRVLLCFVKWKRVNSRLNHLSCWGICWIANTKFMWRLFTPTASFQIPRTAWEHGWQHRQAICEEWLQAWNIVSAMKNGQKNVLNHNIWPWQTTWQATFYWWWLLVLFQFVSYLMNLISLHSMTGNRVYDTQKCVDTVCKYHISLYIHSQTYILVFWGVDWLRLLVGFLFSLHPPFFSVLRGTFQMSFLIWCRKPNYRFRKLLRNKTKTQ